MAAKEKLDNIYEGIYREILPQLIVLEVGLLYKTIQIILREEELERPEKTLNVCSCLGIRRNASRNEDNQIIDSLVDTVDRQPVTQGVRRLGRLLLPSQNKNQFDLGKIQDTYQDDRNMEEIKWIVFGACTLAGVYFCIQYQNEKQQQKSNQERRNRNVTRQVTSPSELTPVALSLIVPADTVAHLSSGSNININDLKLLIDNALYFLCTKPEEADLNERRLATTDEEIPSTSKREVYIRVDIDNGSNLIGKTIPYALKTNLNSQMLCVVTRLLCLRNFSGLQSFNLV